jgi:hypothetical protein
MPNGMFSYQKSQLGMDDFGKFCGHLVHVLFKHLEYFVVFWYISPRFVILYQDKSGIPGAQQTSICIYVARIIRKNFSGITDAKFAPWR